MSMNRFLKAADTGDLILIKFNDDEDKLDIDPAYYNYKFNHVAMIVIAQREGVSENIMILESSHGKGVRLIPIDAYITSLLPGIESMCYKRLTGIRRLDNQFFFQRIHSYLQQTIGKNYNTEAERIWRESLDDGFIPHREFHESTIKTSARMVAEIYEALEIIPTADEFLKDRDIQAFYGKKSNQVSILCKAENSENDQDILLEEEAMLTPEEFSI